MVSSDCTIVTQVQIERLVEHFLSNILLKLNISTDFTPSLQGLVNANGEQSCANWRNPGNMEAGVSGRNK